MSNGNVNTANTELRNTGDSGFFRALISYYIHQDKLLWSRVQTLIAIQGGLLVGSYSLIGKNDWLAFLMPLAAALFTLLLLAVIKRDIAGRDANLRLIDKIAGKLSSPYVDTDAPTFRLIPEVRWNTIRGNFVLSIVIYLLFITDIAMSLLIWFWLSFPNLYSYIIMGNK